MFPSLPCCKHGQNLVRKKLYQARKFGRMLCLHQPAKSFVYLLDGGTRSRTQGCCMSLSVGPSAIITPKVPIPPALGEEERGILGGPRSAVVATAIHLQCLPPNSTRSQSCKSCQKRKAKASREHLICARYNKEACSCAEEKERHVSVGR